MPTDFKFCPVCGSPPPPQERLPQPQQNPSPPIQNYYQNNYYQNPPQNPIGLKSEIITLILSFIIQGAGHLYVGKIGKGIWILVGSYVLLIVGLITLYFGVGVILLIVYFIILIWQIFDSLKLCRQYNDYLSKNGKPPW